MASLKRVVLAATVVAAVYGLAWGYGSAFQDAPPAQSPEYGQGPGGKGKAPGSTMGRYTSATKGKGAGGGAGNLGGAPSGGDMGGSSSGGR